MLLERDNMLDDLRMHLIRAQQKMKQQVDRHRKDDSFEVRDMVFIKLRPYRQKSMQGRKNQKLSTRYYGPF